MIGFVRWQEPFALFCVPTDIIHFKEIHFKEIHFKEMKDILLNSNRREHYESIVWTVISHTQQKIPNIILAITKDAEYLLFYSKQNL